MACSWLTRKYIISYDAWSEGLEILLCCLILYTSSQPILFEQLNVTKTFYGHENERSQNTYQSNKLHIARMLEIESLKSNHKGLLQLASRVHCILETVYCNKIGREFIELCSTQGCFSIRTIVPLKN